MVDSPGVGLPPFHRSFRSKQVHCWGKRMTIILTHHVMPWMSLEQLLLSIIPKLYGLLILLSHGHIVHCCWHIKYVFSHAYLILVWNDGPLDSTTKPKDGPHLGLLKCMVTFWMLKRILWWGLWQHLAEWSRKSWMTSFVDRLLSVPVYPERFCSIFAICTWRLIPLSKWVITLVMNGISGVSPLITRL